MAADEVKLIYAYVRVCVSVFNSLCAVQMPGIPRPVVILNRGVLIVGDATHGTWY